MAEEKRYYWIKIKTDFFSRETIDFLLTQKNGCEYVVLYQMLCLHTANSKGRLATEIGEMIIPYDVDKIVRDTKYFDTDTVIVALELFKKLGLIYEENGGCLRIADYEQMVGSETAGAYRKRLYRDRMKELPDGGHNAGHCPKNVPDNVPQEIRDKRLEYRDKSIDNREREDKEEKPILTDGKKTSTKRFVKPTVEEVAAYCAERKNGVDAERFVDFYESKGWKVGNTPMKDWKAAVRNWENRDKANATPPLYTEADDQLLKGIF